MGDLTKNKAANALVWAAFFAFWLHSLHCCRAHRTPERCVFDLCCLVDHNGPTISDGDVFHRRQRRSLSRARFVCRAVPFLAPSRFESTFAETPSFDRNFPVHKSRCAVACSSLRPPTEKKNSGAFGAFFLRAFADSPPNDVRSLSNLALSNRSTEAFSTPLYLRLRKILN